MTKISTMVSNSMNCKLEIKAYHTVGAHRLRVGLIHPDFYIVLSADIFDHRMWDQIDHRIDEFAVIPIGEDRTIIKEVRELEVFIDTGRRIQFNPNLWGEVWRLRPEHLALIEKETINEQTRSSNQSEH